MTASRFSIALLGLACLSLFGCGASSASQKPLIYGEVELQEIRIASKVTGRLDQVWVQPGDLVDLGQPLFRLDSPELWAKQQQAQAALDAAQALSLRTSSGARNEEIEMARLQWQRAQTQADLLANTQQRLQSLAQEGLLPQQQFDEATAAWQAANDQAEQAKAQYQLTQQGAHQQERAASEAQVRQAAASLAEVEALLADLEPQAPRAAEVASVLLQPGELASAGFPVISLIIPDDQWAIFTVREDQLADFLPGQQFDAFVPALNESLRFQVSRVQALPDFASWRQGRDISMHLRSFQVEARPLTPDARLRSGMTLTRGGPHG